MNSFLTSQQHTRDSTTEVVQACAFGPLVFCTGKTLSRWVDRAPTAPPRSRRIDRSDSLEVPASKGSKVKTEELGSPSQTLLFFGLVFLPGDISWMNHLHRPRQDEGEEEEEKNSTAEAAQKPSGTSTGRRHSSGGTARRCEVRAAPRVTSWIGLYRVQLTSFWRCRGVRQDHD